MNAATEALNFAAAVWSLELIDDLPTNEQNECARLLATYGPAITDQRGYTITRDPETGLQVVRFNGVKIGQTQSPAGAALIRRNHRRNAR